MFNNLVIIVSSAIEETYLHLFRLPILSRLLESIIPHGNRGISSFDECCFISRSSPSKILPWMLLFMGSWKHLDAKEWKTLKK
jgi:hypothetical protein